ncbi:response regulator transcription factor [Micromonospora pattaloongensis]|uniref:response regulator transcription factor n=1 Tax=Micromonospora pattaloongensis TaxID=405436 RepID=UPI000B81BDB8|nr:helix-turn-helix transcriptional regulator [Micromonospora pattaloongensis]
MRTVLVCVRTTFAAQNVASAATRLGMAAAIRTAVSEAEVMLRLSERPAEIVLADTALTRPDSVGFTRRVLAKAPGAVIVLFGAEDPRVAAAAIAAGARGLIHGGDQDMVSVVAKTLLLLSTPGRAAANVGPAQSAAVAPQLGRGAAAPRSGAPVAPSRLPGGRPGAGMPGAGMPGAGMPGAGLGGAPLPAQPGGPAVVPVQRGDDLGPYQPGAVRPSGEGEHRLPTGLDRRGNAVRDGRFAAGPRPGESPAGYQGAPLRRITLTERELQVLRGMAEGKSNAEIGRDLFVSEDTVKTHARRLFRKLGARDRAHAVAAGFRAGLVA